MLTLPGRDMKSKTNLNGPYGPYRADLLARMGYRLFPAVWIDASPRRRELMESKIEADPSLEKFPRKRINETQTRSATAGTPLLYILMAIPFIGIGLLFASAAFLNAPKLRTSVGAPEWMIGIIGAMFGLPGLFMFRQGLAELSQRRRRERARRGGTEPWIADHDWNPRGITDDSFRRIIGSWSLGLFLAVFMIPFVWWSFFSKQGNAVVIVVTLMFCAVAVFVLGYAVYLTFQWMKYGRSRLSFETFPFFTGKGGTILFFNRRLLSAGVLLRSTLRCLEVRYEQNSSRSNRSPSVVCYQRYVDVRDIGIDIIAEIRPTDGLELSLKFPAGAPPTSLSTQPTIYWELVMEAETPGIDFHSSFLLPVYDAG